MQNKGRLWTWPHVKNEGYRGDSDRMEVDVVKGRKREDIK
jgi:hypothetical protein